MKYGINNIYENYKKWCDEKIIQNDINKNIFKEEFEKSEFKKEKNIEKQKKILEDYDDENNFMS